MGRRQDNRCKHRKSQKFDDCFADYSEIGMQIAASNLPNSQNSRMADPTTTSIPSPTTDKAQLYIPSSTEKKRAIIMYLLIGIIWAMGKVATQSDYERFHFKQAIWRWMVFLLVLIASVIFLFIPFIKYIPLFVILGMIIILAICIKQANDGKFGREKKNSLSLFAGIGEWMLGLFEIKEKKE